MKTVSDETNLNNSQPLLKCSQRGKKKSKSVLDYKC